MPDPRATGDQHLRAVFREFSSGVTVASTSGDGVLHAMTANAFCSVSLDPPLVLLCVAHSARFHAAVIDAGHWAVSVLSAHQADLASRFATPGRSLEHQFDGVEYTVGEVTGAALLTGAAAWLECRTDQAVVAGDHTILIGEVVGCEVNAIPQPPLTYHRGGYAPPTAR